MTPPSPLILIIIGITGDLAMRKLLPAVEAISRAGAIPEQFAILGISRQSDVRPESLFTHMKDSTFVRDHLSLMTLDVNDASAYQLLAARLVDIERGFGSRAERLFYLSVPPQASQSIIEMLGTTGLAKVPHTKLLLEKPFGVDLASARMQAERTRAHFTPEQVYRIDHYLAKEMAQNLIVFRQYNSLFRRTWNNEFIERIHISASEEIGVEGRANFYEQTGALRDVVQSHLLQLAALSLMSLLEGEGGRDVPLRRLAALQSLHLPSDIPVLSSVHRGQYRGYREEVRNPGSFVETYVSLTLHSDDPRFIGIPLVLSTGKKLKEKATEIRIIYKEDSDREANELTLRLQPHEGVSLGVWSKRPGYAAGQVERRMLDFKYAEHYGALPDAYEQVLVDTMRSERELFLTSEEVLESWRILAPIQEAWGESDADLEIYEPGSTL